MLTCDHSCGVWHAIRCRSLADLQEQIDAHSIAKVEQTHLGMGAYWGLRESARLPHVGINSRVESSWFSIPYRCLVM